MNMNFFFFQKQVKIIPRLYEKVPISLNISKTVEKLSILVENQGRINFGSFLEDRKVSRLYFSLSYYYCWSDFVRREFSNRSRWEITSWARGKWYRILWTKRIGCRPSNPRRTSSCPRFTELGSRCPATRPTLWTLIWTRPAGKRFVLDGRLKRTRPGGRARAAENELETVFNQICFFVLALRAWRSWTG